MKKLLTGKILSALTAMAMAVSGMAAVASAEITVPDGITPIDTVLYDSVTVTTDDANWNTVFTSTNKAVRNKIVDGVTDGTLVYHKAKDLVFYVNCPADGTYELTTVGYSDYASNYTALVINGETVNSQLSLGSKANTNSTVNEVNQGYVSLNEGVNTIGFTGDSNSVYVRSIMLTDKTEDAALPDGIVPVAISSDSAVTVTVDDANRNVAFTSSNRALRAEVIDGVTGDNIVYHKAVDLVFYVRCPEAGNYTLKTVGYSEYTKVATITVNDTVYNSAASLGIKQATSCSVNEVNQGEISLKKGINTISFTNNAEIFVRSIELVGELVGLPAISTADTKTKITYEAETADSSDTYILSNSTMSFDVNCEAEGDYYFTTYFERNYNSATSMISVSVNGGEAQTFACLCGGYSATDNTPQRFKATALTVSLKQGKNTITVTPPEKLAFDKFELTNYERGGDGYYKITEKGFEVVKETVQASPAITVSDVYDTIPSDVNKADMKAWWADNDNNKTRVVFLASYDESNRLIEVKLQNKRFMMQKAQEIAFDDFDLTGVDKVKLMIWDGFEIMDGLGVSTFTK